MGANKKVSDVQERAAVLRVLAGRSTCEQEAVRCGVSGRTVGRWVEAAKARGEKVEAAPSGAGAPEPSAPSAGAETAGGAPKPSSYERAAAAAGVPPYEPSRASDVKALLAAASAEDVLFCKDVVGGVKQSALCLVASRMYGLPANDTAVIDATRMGPAADAALTANASWLAPQLRKWLGGWGGLSIALGADLFVSIGALKSLGVQRGTIKPKMKDEAAAAAEVRESERAAQERERKAREERAPDGAAAGGTRFGVPGAP